MPTRIIVLALMNQGSRTLLGVVAAAAMFFGVASLNYTYGPSFEHHIEWAAERGLATSASRESAILTAPVGVSPSRQLATG